MASAVNELKSLIPPARAALPELDWSDVERQLALLLPLDYKRLVETYGQGSFDGFLWVLQPSDRNENLDLVRQHRARLSALRTLHESGEEVPFGVEESAEELVPWAITDNGDVCYWVISTSDDPDKWAVAVNEARGPRWKSFELSSSEFLVALLSGDLSVEFFPDDFPSDSPIFDAVTT